MIEDLFDRRIATGATGLLARFNAADVIHAADVHVALRTAAAVGERDETVQLAVALAVRAVRHGSICVDLATVAGQFEIDEPLEWPEPGAWLAALRASELVAQQVVRLENGLLYLDRYHREEVQVCDDLISRLDGPQPAVDDDLLDAGLDRVFARTGAAEQRAAAERAVRLSTTVLTGGPGTGKTTTVARVLAIIAEQHERATGRLPRMALCAPTAKAAARLTDSVAEQSAQLPAVDADRLGELKAMTLHRLLGWQPGSSTRFRHHRRRRLPHDVIVVDETSMVSLTHMARLLEAVRADARLILVGDADQLASVDAGAVLADLVAGLSEHHRDPVARLQTVHRFGGGIGELAQALRDGDAEAAIELFVSSPDLELIDPAETAAVAAFEADVVGHAWRIRQACLAGDGATALTGLGAHRLLCAHREGPYGVRQWNRRNQSMVGDAAGLSWFDQWYPGRPVLVTANDHTLGVYNGDVGVTVQRPDGRLSVVLDGSARELATTRLPDVETVYAMTVHKAQGSQADVVSVVLPGDDSTLLTRELFYTAVTRARTRVRVLGTADGVRAAVERQVVRASGLAGRLRQAGPS